MNIPSHLTTGHILTPQNIVMLPTSEDFFQETICEIMVWELFFISMQNSTCKPDGFSWKNSLQTSANVDFYSHVAGSSSRESRKTGKVSKSPPKSALYLLLFQMCFWLQVLVGTSSLVVVLWLSSCGMPDYLLWGMWDLSPPTRDQTRAPAVKVCSQPFNHQGSLSDSLNEIIKWGKFFEGQFGNKLQILKTCILWPHYFISGRLIYIRTLASVKESVQGYSQPHCLAQ